MSATAPACGLDRRHHLSELASGLVHLRTELLDLLGHILERTAQRLLVLLRDEVLADEGLGVQVLELDLGAKLAAQVRRGVTGHVPHRTDHPYGVTDDLWQALGAEDEQGNECENRDLPPVQVRKHACPPISPPEYAGFGRCGSGRGSVAVGRERDAGRL